MLLLLLFFCHSDMKAWLEGCATDVLLFFFLFVDEAKAHEYWIKFFVDLNPNRSHFNRLKLFFLFLVFFLLNHRCKQLILHSKESPFEFIIFFLFFNYYFPLKCIFWGVGPMHPAWDHWLLWRQKLRVWNKKKKSMKFYLWFIELKFLRLKGRSVQAIYLKYG